MKERAKEVPITEFCNRRGIKVKNNLVKCPSPNHEDRTPSCCIYPRENRYYCHGCKANGDVIDFVQKEMGCGYREAIECLTCDSIPTSTKLHPYAPKEDKIKGTGADFSDIYEFLMDQLPYPVRGDYLTRDRSLDLKELKNNEIRAIPERDDRYYYKNMLLQAFPEERLVKSGVLAIGKKGFPYFFFWECDFIFPFFDDGRAIYLQGLVRSNLRADRGKVRNLPGIKKPTFYIPKTSADKPNICILEGVITTLFFMGLQTTSNAFGLLSSDFKEEGIQELEKFKEKHTFYICPDVDSAGKNVAQKVLDALFKREFKYRDEIVNPRDIGRQLGLSEEALLKVKDLNDLERIKRGNCS